MTVPPNHLQSLFDLFHKIKTKAFNIIVEPPLFMKWIGFTLLSLMAVRIVFRNPEVVVEVAM